MTDWIEIKNADGTVLGRHLEIPGGRLYQVACCPGSTHTWNAPVFVPCPHVEPNIITSAAQHRTGRSPENAKLLNAIACVASDLSDYRAKVFPALEGHVAEDVRWKMLGLFRNLCMAVDQWESTRPTDLGGEG
jgi:hypothetical protein